MTAPFLPREFIAQVARRHGMSADWLLSRRRDAKTYAARHEVIHALHSRNWTNGQIGRLLGRDPSTIFHALRGKL